MAQTEAVPASLDQLEANRQVAYRFYEELWNKGNYEAAPELLHPNHYDHTLPPIPGLPQGRDGVIQLMTTFRAAFPDLVMSVDRVIAEGDFVGEVLTLRGTHTGTFAGIPPTGKPIEIKSVNICRIEDGLVRERWGASDDLGLLRQIGVLPSPGTRAWNASIRPPAHRSSWDNTERRWQAQRRQPERRSWRSSCVAGPAGREFRSGSSLARVLRRGRAG